MIPKIPINKTTIIIAAFLLLLAYAGIQTHRAQKFKEGKELAELERDQAVEVASLGNQKIEYYQNSYNDEVAKTKQLELTRDNLSRLRETEKLQFLKRFENLKKDLSNVQAASATDLDILEDSIPKQVVNIPCESDSIKAFWYRLKDEFNSISVVALDSPEFDITVPVYTVDEFERKMIGLRIGRKIQYPINIQGITDQHPRPKRKIVGLRIGKKEYFRETVSPNKLVKIKSQHSFVIKKRNKRR